MPASGSVPGKGKVVIIKMRPRKIKFLFAMMAIGCIVAILALAWAPVGRSQRIHTVRTLVSWTGTGCIDITSPQIANRYFLTTETICDPNDQAGYIAFQLPGEWIGADPIMGNATTISCEVYIDGVLSYVDLAVRGDGSDVNCLGTLTERGNGFTV